MNDNLYNIGEYVKLTGVYKDDKVKQGKPYSGMVTYYSLDKSRDVFVYSIEGVGHYGEPALIKDDRLNR
jgi:hypothetical protein